MIWKRKTLRPLEAIARTGFLVSLTSYALFWIADVIEPGFVSRFFSVHLFLLSSIVFGLAWTAVMETYTSRPRLHRAVALLCGVVLCVLTWSLVGDVGAYRVLLSLIALATPSIIYSHINT